MRREDFRFLHVATWAPALDWAPRLHAHPFHEVVYLAKGRLEAESALGRIPARPGDLITYPEGLEHIEIPSRTENVEIWYLGWKGEAPGFSVLPDARGRVRTLMSWLLADRKGAASESTPLAEALVDELHRLEAPARDTMVEAVRAHVLAHLAEELSLDDLAAVAGEDRFQFVRIFKKATGLTPMAEVRRLRMETARDLLLGDSRPLREVAAHCGYASEFSFHRTFTRAFGLPPGRFRRQAES